MSYVALEQILYCPVGAYMTLEKIIALWVLPSEKNVKTMIARRRKSVSVISVEGS